MCFGGRRIEPHARDRVPDGRLERRSGGTARHERNLRIGDAALGVSGLQLRFVEQLV